MQSVSTINKSKLYFLSFFLIASFFGNAQENSPFSRYGLGDLVPSQNIVNRAMGGFNSTYSSSNSINFSNPASYSSFAVVNYDIGITLESRSLRSANPVQKYNSVNLTPSYVALGVPVSIKHKIGLAFGLMPLTKVNYNINESKRINDGKDSILSLYEGDGGLYQGFVGIAKRWKGLSVGINTGLLFGRKDIVTRTIVIDSFLTYKSNSSDNTSFNHLFLNFGLQYEDTLGRKGKLTTIKFGFSGNMKQKLSGNKIINRETYTYDINDNPITIDSVYNSGSQSGTITLPASYTAGFSINGLGLDKGLLYQKSMIGIEYTTSKWSQFRNFGEPDRLINSWQARIGGQLTPKVIYDKSYWSLVSYRAGFYFGKEAVNADGNELPVYGITIGAGFPLLKYRSYDYQSTVLNTTLEIGKRGNSKNNITESFFRFAVSVNLSDRWFIKRKYD